MTYYSAERIKQVVTDPREIVALLDKHIVGQDAAKKSLALMLFRRSLVRLQVAEELPAEPVFDKSNVLLIGPTGTGKTSLIRALSEISGSPIGIDDITEVTSAGYIGGKVEEILERYVLLCEEWVDEHYESFLQQASTTTVVRYADGMEYMEVFNNEQESYTQMVRQVVENGIIYIDEIDKIRQSTDRGRDIGGDCVQNELLKFLENGRINLWGNKKETAKRCRSDIISVDTKNITFVCGGAFQGLEDTIKQRLKTNVGIGFNSSVLVTDKNEIMAELSTEDLIQYGFKPEFLGRLPIRTCLDQMTVEMMKKIITEPKDNLYDQYRLVFNMFDINFSIDEEAMDYLAKKALESNIGARSLKEVFTKLLTDILYNLYDYTDKDFKIGLEYVKERL